ncbi:MAG: adenylate kinase [Flavobacteriales bacterium]|nr:adenylate kinase [Flavobacteriales bacterium]MCX7650928.1 adenylate kinase [Flavobacteriales bacterium]MDW8432818.1 adenylate kinase [Flavobacteriales bacterium]
MKTYILFGPPGAGKGTQAEKLARHFHLLHLSTGDIFRREMASGTPLGLEAKRYIEAGKLVPDEVTIAMLRGYLSSHPAHEGVILDGFPRTIPQAQALDQLLAEARMPLCRVFSLEVPDEELIARLQNRARTSGRSDDARLEVIQKRLEVYKAETLPLKEYYKNRGLLEEVEGTGAIEEIFSDICARIQKMP